MNLRMAALGALALSFSAVTAADACERCKSAQKQCACQKNDDGLLFRLDAWAGKLHKSVKRSADSLTGASKQKSQCDHGPNCGCEMQASPQLVYRSEPDCGAELRVATPPTCGCEQAPACGCELHSSSSPIGSYYDDAPYQPIDTTSQPWSPPPIPQSTKRNQQVPTPAPIPDNKVDPFRDEGTPAARRIPARTIQFRRAAPALRQKTAPAKPPAPSYGSRFDDQAGTIRFRMSDTVSAAKPIRLAPRAGTAAPARIVVSASAEQPVRLPTKADPQRLPKPQPPEHYNPLRG